VQPLTDAGENEGELLVLLGQRHLEAGAGGDKFDDGRLPAGALEEGQELGGLGAALGGVDDTGQRLLLRVVDAARLCEGGLLGRDQLLDLGAPVVVVLAVPEDRAQALLDQELSDVAAEAKRVRGSESATGSADEGSRFARTHVWPPPNLTVTQVFSSNSPSAAKKQSSPGMTHQHRP
jgi:hypothetical protein